MMLVNLYKASSATVLAIGATDEIDLTATAVDLDGTLNVSGVATFQATPVFPDGSLAVLQTLTLTVQLI